MLVPTDVNKDLGIVMEFKARRPQKETSLEDTIGAALEQIRGRNYATELVAAGVPQEHVRAYGFAFEGKQVLIGGGPC